MKKRSSLILYCVLFLCLLNSAFADTRFNIGIINKKGMNKGLILLSEMYSTEVLDSNQEIMLKMVNGLKLRLNAHYIDDSDTYGPSALLKTSGWIINSKGKIVKAFSEQIRIGESKVLIYQEDDDQLIEIHLSPIIYK